MNEILKTCARYCKKIILLKPTKQDKKHIHTHNHTNVQRKLTYKLNVHFT